MLLRWRLLPVLALSIALVAVPSASAESDSGERTCKLSNAAGSVEERAALRGAGKQAEKKQKARKKQAKKKAKVTLQPEPTSAKKVVNLGNDRESEEVTFHVTVSPKASPGFANKLGIVAEPFASTSETGETVTFSEPMFSKPKLSANGKRITFAMCVDAPNDLPAGKYTSTVLLEGPQSTEPAVMTVTLNAKDGSMFIVAAALTALLSFFILLYKAAGERRALSLAEAEKEGDDKREDAIEQARKWWKPIGGCLTDLGWWVPTVAAVVSAFAVLYAAYAANPAWGEGGIVTSAIALIGTGLAAVGAKTVFTQGTPGK
jgi:hypothetical protein